MNKIPLDSDIDEINALLDDTAISVVYDDPHYVLMCHSRESARYVKLSMLINSLNRLVKHVNRGYAFENMLWKGTNLPHAKRVTAGKSGTDVFHSLGIDDHQNPVVAFVNKRLQTNQLVRIFDGKKWHMVWYVYRKIWKSNLVKLPQYEIHVVEGEVYGFRAGKFDERALNRMRIG